MCWSHVHRAIVPQLRHLSSLSKDTAKALLSDIEDIQWSANNSTFKNLVRMLEEKYLKSSNNTAEISSAIQHFFIYFRSVWVDGAENNWFEGSNPFASSNNQGIEGKNRDIKGSHTFRKRMPLGSFFDVMLRMVHEWSLEDNSLLGSERKSVLFSKPDGLKMRSNSYQWFIDHRSNNNYAEIKLQGKKLQTLLPNVTSIWAVPSTNTKLSELPLKELAKTRLSTRFDSTSKNFDEFMKIRNSCHLVEQIGDEFFCDCYVGSKARLYKHAVGLMFKTGVLEITANVRSKPLGQKRKHGRPKKLPACLVRSPEPASVGTTVTARYQNPSPNISLLSLPSPPPSPVPVSVSALSSPPHTQMSPVVALSLEVEPSPKAKRKRGNNVEAANLPPAKRKSRVKLTYCEAQENISNIK